MTFDVVVYRSGKPWADRWERAVVAGLERSGVVPEQRRTADLRASDLAVIWAHKHDALFELQRSRGGRYLVMELGFVGNRREWTSLGVDGLNGRACWPEPDADRWADLFGDHLCGWRPGGDYALVCGQVPGDASLRGLDIEAWAQQASVAASEVFGVPARIRPHPGTGRCASPLADDLDGAAVCVTYNSNAGVEAALYGVPVVAMDRGSMAWPVAAHDFSVCRPDRAKWCAQLATCQWSEDEIRSGVAWEHLEPMIR